VAATVSRPIKAAVRRRANRFAHAGHHPCRQVEKENLFAGVAADEDGAVVTKGDVTRQEGVGRFVKMEAGGDGGQVGQAQYGRYQQHQHQHRQRLRARQSNHVHMGLIVAALGGFV
jgi:hypothetical protein